MFINQAKLEDAIRTWLLNPFSCTYDLANDCFKISGIKYNNSDIFALETVLDNALNDGLNLGELVKLVTDIFRENY